MAGTRMKQRRGTAAEWAAANEILDDGSMGIEEDTEHFKIGDGVTPWNDLETYYIPKQEQDATYVARDLVNAAGDILVGSADNTLVRLPRGAVGSRLTIQPDLSLAWVDLPPAANPFTGVDAAGDLLVGSAPDTVARLPAGAEGRVLQILGGLPAWVVPAAADLTSRVAKAGDVMTGRLKMDNGTGLQLRGQAGDNANDIVIFKAGGASLLIRKTDGVTNAPVEAGAIYDSGNRVYSASNPPPVSGMKLLNGNVQTVVYAGTNLGQFICPAGGMVVMRGTALAGTTNHTLKFSLDNSTWKQATSQFNTGGGGIAANPFGQAVFTGLTPGATYTMYCGQISDGTLVSWSVEG